MSTSFPRSFFSAAQDTVFSLYVDPGSSLQKATALVDAHAEIFAAHQVLGTVSFALGNASAGLDSFARARELARDEAAEFVFTDADIAGEQRLEPVLQAVDENIWVLETLYDIVPGGPFKFPGNMTIVRLHDGGLLLVNPVELQDAIAQMLAELGEVTHVVTQTTFHYRFLDEYQNAFAKAAFFGTPAQEQKPEVQHLRFDGYLQDHTPMVGDEIDQVTFSGHAFNETALMHRDSKTLIVADLAMNGCEPISTFFNFYAWLWGVHGRCGCPHYHRLMVLDKAAAMDSMKRILALDFERIVFAHGHPVQENAKPLFEEMWSEVFDAC